MIESEDLIAGNLFRPARVAAQVDETSSVEGERRMLEQVLVDAIECWRAMSLNGVVDENCVASSRERLFREANFWIFVKYRNAPFFSFTQICDCLGLDPDFIRRRLLEWRRRSCRADAVEVNK